MTEYWILSAPAEKNMDETWNILNRSMQKLKKCTAYKFYIPALKVGTLDTLLTDADDLNKLEMFLEGLSNRLVSSLENVLEVDKLKKEKTHIDNEPIHEYIISFKWDVAKFPPKQAIKSLANLAHKQALQIDNDYKRKFQEYISIRGEVEAIEKNDQGSLLTRNLNDIVTEEDFVMNSEFMRTVLVVIGKKLYTDWLRTYEHFDQTVVPRSSRLIAEDHEYCLVGVTLFKDRLKNFTEIAKKFKFIVRDYVYDEREKRLYKKHYLQVKKKKETLYEPLLKILRHDFSEIFKSQIHVKACRLFVESVLRYGLPANFSAAIIVVNKKDIKKLRDILYHLYKHLDVTSGDAEKTPNVEVMAMLGHHPADYFPYVCYRINVDMS